MKTRYRRNVDPIVRELEYLRLELQALRAEIACLRANQVQIATYPKPDPMTPYGVPQSWLLQQATITLTSNATSLTATQGMIPADDPRSSIDPLWRGNLALSTGD